jgi:hypothetical protein
MTIEQMHSDWLAWVKPLMAVTAKSDLSWLAWQEAYKRAAIDSIDVSLRQQEGTRPIHTNPVLAS